MTAILVARGLTTGYGSQRVVHDLDLEVRPGEIVAMLGPNGAGKTTTLLALSGELPLMSGDVEMNGVIVKSPLHRRVRDGLGFVPEERSIFRTMSAADNLRCGAVSPEEAVKLFPELEPRLRVRGGLLSGGEQQMLVLARALLRHPKLLLADELSLGLAPMVVERLLATLRARADKMGMGILLVEQHVHTVLRYADRVYGLRGGEIVMACSAREATERIGELEDAYLTAGASRSAGR